MGPRVSIIIPTYKRASTLKYVLEGLKEQTYKNFELIIVFKPSGDETQRLLKQYIKDLTMKIVTQKYGFITDAYNLGLEEATGQIVAFLDDDAIPYPNWLEEHVKTYIKHSKVGGVSGPSMSAKITRDGRIIQVPEDFICPHRGSQRSYSFPWMLPIHGMSNWLIFFGRDGLVHHHPQLRNGNFQRILPSLLHMGANMSVKKEAIEGLSVTDNLILGFAFEQLLGYQIWDRRYALLFNPNAKVSHIIHSESMGRFFKNPKRAALRDAEFVLTFSILKSQEKDLSWIAYILGIITLIISRVFKAKENGIRISMYRIYGLLSGFVTGSAYLISKTIKGSFHVRASLKRLQ